LKKSNPQHRNMQKPSPKNKQISIEQAQKQATRKSSKKKPATPQIHKKNKPKFVGKPQGWQHCYSVLLCCELHIGNIV